MAAIDDLNAITAKLEAAVNALGRSSSAAAVLTQTGAAKDATIFQHVARIAAVTTAISNAASELDAAVKAHSAS